MSVESEGMKSKLVVSILQTMVGVIVGIFYLGVDTQLYLNGDIKTLPETLAALFMFPAVGILGLSVALKCGMEAFATCKALYRAAPA